MIQVDGWVYDCHLSELCWECKEVVIEDDLRACAYGHKTFPSARHCPQYEHKGADYADGG